MPRRHRALDGTDRAIAKALPTVVTVEARQLDPKTWYGFLSYAHDGKVVFSEDALRDDPPVFRRSLRANGPGGAFDVIECRKTGG